MLQRDRHLRMQVQQLADASLFAASFWLAYCLRENVDFSNWLSLDLIAPDAFNNVVKLHFGQSIRLCSRIGSQLLSSIGSNPGRALKDGMVYLQLFLLLRLTPDRGDFEFGSDFFGPSLKSSIYCFDVDTR